MGKQQKKVIDPGPRLLQRFTLENLPPTMNQTLKLVRSRSKNRKFCQYNQEKRNWDEDIAAIVASEGLIPYTTPVWIHLDFYCDKKADFSNIRASDKYIFDAMVNCELIPSDSQQWLHPSTDSFHSPQENAKVVVSICNYPMNVSIPLDSAKGIADKLVENLNPQMLKNLYDLLGKQVN